MHEVTLNRADQPSGVVGLHCALVPEPVTPPITLLSRIVCALAFRPYISPHSTSRQQLLGSGQCGCIGVDLTQGDDYLRVLDSIDTVSTLLEDYSADVKREVAYLLCSGVMNDGDHLQVSGVLWLRCHTHVALTLSSGRLCPRVPYVGRMDAVEDAGLSKDY